MAREVVVWCDPCLAERDKHVAASEVVVLLPDMKTPKSVDLCTDCSHRFIAPVWQLLNEYGKTVHADAAPKVRKSAPPRPDARRYAVPISEDIGPLFCHVPDCGGYSNKRGYRSIAHVQKHVRMIHPEVSWEEYLERFGEPKTGDRPPDQEQLELGEEERGQEVFECEECGKTYTYEETSRPAQALGVHKSMKHGIRGKKNNPQQPRRRDPRLVRPSGQQAHDGGSERRPG
jgi:hypothetical protein